MSTSLIQNSTLSIKTLGSIDSLHFVSTPRRILAEDEIEIEVFATPLNFKEILYALGMLSSAEQFHFGLECVGKVTAIGSSVNKFSPGDKVMAFTKNGMSAFVIADQKQVFPIPKSCNLLEAATIPVPFLTAYYALNIVGRLQKGDTVLIHSAAGGVGLAALQVAKNCGATIFATASTLEKQNYLKSLGIHHIMNSRTLDFADEIMIATENRGVDVILNSLSGEFLQKSLNIVAENGHFIELGIRDIAQNNSLSLGLFAKGFSFSSLGVHTGLPLFNKAFQEILYKLNTKIFTPLPYKVYFKDNIVEAFKYMARAKHIGRVIVAHHPLISFDYASPSDINSSLEIDGLSTQEACDIFDQIMQYDIPQIIISTQSISERIELPTNHIKNSLITQTLKNYHERPQLSVDYLEPRTPIEVKLTEVWQHFFKIDKIGVHDNFFDLGGDSLLAVQLISELHSKLNLKLPVHTIIEAPTIEKLAQTLHLHVKDNNTSSQLVKLNTISDQKRKIFLIHPVGGTVYFYKELANLLPEFSVFGIQAKAIVDESSISPASVEELAASYIGIIRQVQTDGPYILGGSSFGGLVAYEMAQQLHRQSQQTELVFMLDTAAQDQINFDKIKDDLDVLIYLTRVLNPDLNLPISYLKSLSYEEQLYYFTHDDQIIHKLLPDIPPEKIQRIVELFRINLQLIMEYQPSHYRGNVLFFKATEHDDYNSNCPEVSWTNLVKGKFEVVQVTGNHTTMNSKPHINLVAKNIMERL